MLGFERMRSGNDFRNTSPLALITNELSSEEAERYSAIKRNWNFYEGYHWQDLPKRDGPELTINYCRAFVNKIVSFELGKAFTFSVRKELETIPVSNQGETLFKFLERVWEDNSQYQLCTEIGQMKSVTGEAWLRVSYVPVDELNDPFGKYPDGRIRIDLLPSETVWAEFDPHDRTKLTRVTVMYTYKRTTYSGPMQKKRTEDVLFKQIWTDDTVYTYDGVKSNPTEEPNRYGIIPFTRIQNMSISCRTGGYSDLDDIIPLNTEYNMKASDVSEIIDYHASPVTVVYGAKIGSLEKGANKMWGGLAKDAKVENLELQGDLTASTNFLNDLKQSMCEVGGVPESVLGGAKSISNTSGVALQYMNLPLIEKCNQKRMSTEDGLEKLNAIIILVASLEAMIRRPDQISPADFFFTAVEIPDTLPKDELLELQRIQMEMHTGLECREYAMRRIGKENISDLMQKIDEDILLCPEFYGLNQEAQAPEINSGILNGSNPKEVYRVEVNGRNAAEGITEPLE